MYVCVENGGQEYPLSDHKLLSRNKRKDNSAKAVIHPHIQSAFRSLWSLHPFLYLLISSASAFSPYHTCGSYKTNFSSLPVTIAVLVMSFPLVFQNRWHSSVQTSHGEIQRSQGPGEPWSQVKGRQWGRDHWARELVSEAGIFSLLSELRRGPRQCLALPLHLCQKWRRWGLEVKQCFPCIYISLRFLLLFFWKNAAKTKSIQNTIIFIRFKISLTPFNYFVRRWFE